MKLSSLEASSHAEDGNPVASTTESAPPIPLVARVSDERRCALFALVRSVRDLGQCFLFSDGRNLLCHFAVISKKSPTKLNAGAPMKKTIQIIAVAALLSISAHSFAGKTDDGGYLGDRTPKEKEICDRVWEVYSGDRTICFLRGKELVVGDASATLEKLNRLTPDSQINSDDAYWAHQRIKMIFSNIFNDTRLDMNAIESVMTIAPRTDMCRRMEKKTFVKIYGSPGHKAAIVKGEQTDEGAESSREYIWKQSTITPCPKAP